MRMRVLSFILLSTAIHAAQAQELPQDYVGALRQALANRPEIGADSDNGIGRTFDGSIDEVAVFNYSFTPQQILNLYNSAFAPSAPSVTLTIQKVGNNVQLSWPQGTLLEATTVNGPYTTNNATSPYNFAPTGAAKFFRVKVQ